MGITLDSVLVEVTDRNYVRIGVIDLMDATFESFLEYNGTGSFVVRLPADSTMAPALTTPGAGVVISDVVTDTVLMEGPVLEVEYTTNKDNGRTFVECKGASHNVFLGDYLCWPEPTNPDPTTQTKAYDKRSGPIETLMHQYVAANMGPDAGSTRAKPGLTMGTDLARGTTQEFSARFDVLAEVLTKLGNPEGIGFRLALKSGGLVFETYATQDRTAEVRLSMESQELEQITAIRTAPSVTRVIVGGQDQLTNRQFQYLTTDEASAAEAEWGRRIERFVDQRRTESAAEQAKAGEDLLKEGGFTGYAIQATPAEDTSLIFGQDYYLGDLVTIENDGAEYGSRITGLIVRADAGGVRWGFTIGDVATFSTERGNAGRMAQLDQRVATLEKVAETTPRVIAAVRRTTAQSIPNASSTPILWDAVDIDTHNMVDGTDITVPYDGLYRISACGSLDPDGTPTSFYWVISNGSNANVAVVERKSTGTEEENTHQVVRGTIYRNLTAGYVLRLNLFQSSSPAASKLTLAGSQTTELVVELV